MMPGHDRGAVLPRPAAGRQCGLHPRDVYGDPAGRRSTATVYCTSLRNPELELLDLLATADAMVVTVLAAGGARPASATAGNDDGSWDVTHLAALDVPILQGLCLTSSRATWAGNDDGLSPLDVATQVAVPEFDGRIITVPFSFKEIDSDGLISYVPDPERCARVAGLAVKYATLRKVAARISGWAWCSRPIPPNTPGSAMPSDWTPRPAAVALLTALREAGYRIGDVPGVEAGDGDALMHALIERGGQDPGLAHRRQAGRQPDPGSRRPLPGVVRRATEALR